MDASKYIPICIHKCKSCTDIKFSNGDIERCRINGSGFGHASLNVTVLSNDQTCTQIWAEQVEALYDGEGNKLDLLTVEDIIAEKRRLRTRGRD